MIIEFLIEKWPDVFGEPKAQREANIVAGGMKPDRMSWEQWCDASRQGYFFGSAPECHWYDPPELTQTGSCRGDLHHNHQPRIMRWYWASPLAWIVPPLYFLWGSGGAVGLTISASLGNFSRRHQGEATEAGEM